MNFSQITYWSDLSKYSVPGGFVHHSIWRGICVVDELVVVLIFVDFLLAIYYYKLSSRYKT